MDVNWPWLPFAVAWSLTAWLPIAMWASRPGDGYTLGPQVDSLLGDVPAAALCGLLYAAPWVMVMRPWGALLVGVCRALSVLAVATVAGAVLAAAPQNHLPSDTVDPCWMTSSRDAIQQQWCDDQSMHDLEMGGLLAVFGLGLVLLAAVSGRWIPAQLSPPLPAKVPAPERQDLQVLVVMALGPASLLAWLGAWAGGNGSLVVALVWFSMSCGAVLYGSWLSGERIGREPARSVAIGLAWLAHTGPLAAGLSFYAQGEDALCIRMAVVGWLAIFARQCALLAEPEPDYESQG